MASLCCQRCWTGLLRDATIRCGTGQRRTGLITFEENGFPVELLSQRDIERAVAHGKVRADTVVKEYGPSGTVRTARADEIARLQPLLTPPEPTGSPPAPVEVAAPPLTQARPSHSAPRLPLFETSPPVTHAPIDHAGEHDLEHKAVDEEPQRRPSWGWIAAAALAVTLLFWWGLGRSTPTGGGDRSSESAPLPTDVVGSARDYWASRTVTARRSPGSTSGSLGTLRRDDRFRGVAVRGPDGTGEWVRVEDGRFAGAYVWSRNLGTETRPVLEQVLPGDPTRVAVARPTYAAPDFSAAQGEVLAVGTSSRVVGRTADGWWEVLLDGGGVGYLPSDAILSACVGGDCRVVTASGWGGIVTGMTASAALRASGLTFGAGTDSEGGTPPDPDQAACAIYSLANGPSAVGVFVEDGLVTSVVIEGEGGAEFTTERGIHIGDAEAAVRRAYPKLTEKPDIYSDLPDKKLFFYADGGRGIKFGIKDGRVAEIAAGGKSIEYVEGCL